MDCRKYIKQVWHVCTYLLWLKLRHQKQTKKGKSDKINIRCGFIHNIPPWIHIYSNPIILLNSSILTLESGLVKMSAIISVVGVYWGVISPLSTVSLNQNWDNLICFILLCFSGFLVTAMVDWLSMYRVEECCVAYVSIWQLNTQSLNLTSL